MRLPANHKMLARENAGASYLLLSAAGCVARWWPADSLLETAELLPEQIKQLRAKGNWTGEQFGELCGVGKAAVANWERGLRRPTTTALIALYHNLDAALPAELPEEPSLQTYDEARAYARAAWKAGEWDAVITAYEAQNPDGEPPRDEDGAIHHGRLLKEGIRFFGLYLE